MPAPKIEIIKAASVERLGKQLSMTPTTPNSKALLIRPRDGHVLSKLNSTRISIANIDGNHGKQPANRNENNDKWTFCHFAKHYKWICGLAISCH